MEWGCPVVYPIVGMVCCHCGCYQVHHELRSRLGVAREASGGGLGGRHWGSSRGFDRIDTSFSTMASFATPYIPSVRFVMRSSRSMTSMFSGERVCPIVRESLSDHVRLPLHPGEAHHGTGCSAAQHGPRGSANTSPQGHLYLPTSRVHGTAPRPGTRHRITPSWRCQVCCDATTQLSKEETAEATVQVANRCAPAGGWGLGLGLGAAGWGCGGIVGLRWHCGAAVA